jgi:hypothetical protein
MKLKWPFQITKGISSARSDDTKSIKTAVVDWITPTKRVLSPPIQRNVKDNRGFHHPRTGELLCPVNLDWSDEKCVSTTLSNSLLAEHSQDSKRVGQWSDGSVRRSLAAVFVSPL